jgi:hypothetical protein
LERGALIDRGWFVAKESSTTISRREFARHAAISAAVTFVPSRALSESPTSHQRLLQQAADAPKLSPEAQTEADARYQTIMSLYGSRFSEAQNADLRRLNLEAQTVLSHLRADQLANSDNPALYLKPLVEREKKSASGASAVPPTMPKS